MGLITLRRQFDPVSAPKLGDGITRARLVAQWQSNRLISERLLVRFRPSLASGEGVARRLR